jgi:hypothetical protein
MSYEDVLIKDLDEGMFYLFLFFSMYVVKTAFIQFNVEAIRNHTKINMVDISTQTGEDEEKDFYEIYEDSIEQLEVVPKKKRYMWIF